MSLTTTIGAGALIGGFAAFAVYAAAAPSDGGAVAMPVVPTFAPVPTPTVTEMAEGCEAPAVLTGGECVLTTPGPTVVVTVPNQGSRTTGRTTPATGDGSDDDDRYDDDHHDDDDGDDDDEDHDDDGDDDRDDDSGDDD